MKNGLVYSCVPHVDPALRPPLSGGERDLELVALSCFRDGAYLSVLKNKEAVSISSARSWQVVRSINVIPTIGAVLCTATNSRTLAMDSICSRPCCIVIVQTSPGYAFEQEMSCGGGICSSHITSPALLVPRCCRRRCWNHIHVLLSPFHPAGGMVMACVMIGHLVFQSLLISVGLGATAMGVAASSSGGVSKDFRIADGHIAKRVYGVAVVWRSVEILACVVAAHVE